VPWSLSERYYVCYDDGRVETFGKADATTSDDRSANARYGAVGEKK
jgi:hypothetical protein